MSADYERLVSLDEGDALGRHWVKVDIVWLFREANERVVTTLDGASQVLERHYRAVRSSVGEGSDLQVEAQAEGVERIRAADGDALERAPSAGYQPSPAELLVQNRRLVGEVQNWLPDGDVPTNQVHLMRAAGDDELYIYKPVSGEKLGRRWGIPPVPGEAAKREVAAFRLNELLGFRLVPPTALVDGPHGPGSLQRFVPDTSEPMNPTDYPESQQHQMAVLDFVLGNSDSGFTNFRTTSEGDLVAFDHELTLPESPAPLYGDLQASHYSHFLRSPDTERMPLHEDVMRAVSSVDPERIRAAFTDLGLSDDAVQGALTRLEFVRSDGMVPSTPYIFRAPRIVGITPVVG
ncbi:hypothetical protein [Nocardia jinanensis]|uniref:PI3K/PI4K catalytic domain-containing protein n=1 Tax=Nocardia jinanensis TaxID=382504 RepID=A0A917RXA4_9NOCA|nr:hypothetical protein [Nocardia jinanensis]GGL41679.1 hypothetical protein GCM10011588_65440 [Nocardia jinanensis]